MWSFTGEQNDANGLEYLRARYYDPTQGRFLTRDPFAGLVAVPQSQNRYPYVLNNPALYRDPYGYWPSLGDVWDKTKDVVGAVADFCDRADCATYALDTGAVVAAGVGVFTADPALVAAGGLLWQTSVTSNYIRYQRGQASEGDVWNAFYGGLPGAAEELGLLPRGSDLISALVQLTKDTLDPLLPHKAGAAGLPGKE